MDLKKYPFQILAEKMLECKDQPWWGGGVKFCFGNVRSPTKFQPPRILLSGRSRFLFWGGVLLKSCKTVPNVEVSLISTTNLGHGI